MITKIITTDFKGLSFDQELGQYNLFLGENGTGKSARTEALCIAILGYNPRDAQKRTGDIYHTHSAGGEWSVGAEMGDQTIMRTFSNGGRATQEITMNGKRLKGNQVEAALVRAGDPKIFDLSGFMGLSDNKKLEYLFDLFPPEENVSEIEARLAELAQKESSLSEKQKGIAATITRLTKEKADIQISGTLAEIQADIERKEAELETAKNDLNEVVAQEREEEARKAGKEESKQEAEKEASTEAKIAKLEDQVDKAKGSRNVPPLRLRPETNEIQHRWEPPTDSPVERSPHGDPSSLQIDFATDLDALKSTMEAAGCEFCAAMIQLKGMIRKHKGVGNG